MGLDPAVRAALPRFFGTEDPAPADPVRAGRERMERLAAYGPALRGAVAVRDIVVPAGDRGVGVRAYAPPSPSGPAFVFFHGGGWVCGSVETYDVICRALSAALGAAVVSVDYRLAPEHRFPAALDDAWTATLAISAQPGRFGGPEPGVVVGGDSAGGALAAAVARRARDSGLELAGQALLYPVLDQPADHGSYETYAEGYGLTRETMAFYWRTYVGDGGGDDPDAAPLRCSDMTGLAPAVVVTAECDVLRDEGEAYASRLRAAAVPVAASRCPGVVHGFLRIAGEVAAAGAAFDQAVGLIAEMFGYRSAGG